MWSFGFRSSSPWVFLRVRPWIDSLSRTLVPDGSLSYDSELRYVEDARGPLAFDDNDTLEPRVTRPVGDEERRGASFQRGLAGGCWFIATVIGVAKTLGDQKLRGDLWGITARRASSRVP